jgi:CRISPR type III-associated protein (TIGR04423 family)
MEQLENEGYVWLSDANEPIIIEQFSDNDGQVEIIFGEYSATISTDACSLKKDGKDIKIPFIIESLFVMNNVSYQIKFVDGNYIVYSKNLNTIVCSKNSDNVKDENSTAITYLPNRFEGNIKGLNFRRLWEEKEDPLCEGMKVLVPTIDLFVGFNR